MELAARRGETKYDPDDYDRLKAAYLQARIRYFEVVSTAAHRRFAIAQERSRRGLIPVSELPLFQKSIDDADVALAAERKKLEKPDPTGEPATTAPGPHPSIHRPTPAPAPAPTPPPAR